METKILEGGQSPTAREVKEGSLIKKAILQKHMGEYALEGSLERIVYTILSKAEEVVKKLQRRSGVFLHEEVKLLRGQEGIEIDGMKTESNLWFFRGEFYITWDGDIENPVKITPKEALKILRSSDWKRLPALEPEEAMLAIASSFL